MTAFTPGDRVYGTTGIGLGAYAEYVCAGGSFGTHAVQLAKQAGAEVVAVDSGGKLEMLRGLWASLTSDRKMIFSLGAATAEHLRAVTELVEAGELRPVIDRRYPLEQTAEAHRYADTEQKLGNIVIVVGREQGPD